jgi:hypothetical protein
MACGIKEEPLTLKPEYTPPVGLPVKGIGVPPKIVRHVL